MAETKLTNLVNPQVMADMISATLPKKIKFAPLAGIDTTLAGVPGDTITVPKYAYIGDAADVAEGVAMGTTVLTASTTTAKVKKAGKAGEITDEAVLSGYGDPAGELQRQLTMSIAAKIDNDCYEALKGATLKHDSKTNAISYEGVVEAIDKFESEKDGALVGVIYVHPKQVTQIRKDPNFLDINKYPITNGMIMSGIVGQIAGFQVVPSKKVELNSDQSAYINPIVVSEQLDPNEDPGADKFGTSTPALTIYMKRGVQLESDRDILKKTTVYSADEHYAVALSNDSKVVLAEFKK